jgi:hypothetical protein
MKSTGSQKMSPPPEAADQKSGKAPQPRAHQVTAREGAMLILHLVDTKSAEPSSKEITRCRISEMTMRRFFRRKLISPEFLMEVQNWLFRAGWVLFFAGDSYALVKLRVVNGWIRIGSKRLAEDLRDAERGSFNFEKLEPLLLGDDDADNEEE